MSIQHICAICGKQVSRKEHLLCVDCYASYSGTDEPWLIALKKDEQARRKAAWRAKNDGRETVLFSSLTTRELEHATKII